MPNFVAAIREDRTRGGRSSYDGCSPHGRVKGTPPPQTIKPPKPIPRKIIHTPPPVREEQPPNTPRTIMVPTSSGHVLAVLEHDKSGEGSSSSGGNVKTEEIPSTVPHTPQTLEDLLTLESLMMEDEGEQACCEGKLREGDQDLFGSLLHIADHCLYKIVRWARNLPDFAAISVSFVIE